MYMRERERERGGGGEKYTVGESKAEEIKHLIHNLVCLEVLGSIITWEVLCTLG